LSSAAAWQATPPPDEIARSGAPRIGVEDVPACPVCGGRAASDLAVGFDYELLTCSNPWRFVRCAECGHARLDPRPPAAALPVIYPPTYYSYNYAAQVPGLALRGKEWLDGRKFASILGALDRPPQSFLDVGCGDGRYLRLLERRGVPRPRIHGLELDARVVESLRAEGFSVHAERIEECQRFEPASLDLVSMFHVIEHLADPGAAVDQVARWLRPGGVFALETPNLESLDARLFESGLWGGYHIPRHWHVFTPGSLRRLLEARGFEVVGLRYQTGHSFWMYSLHHRLRYATPPRTALSRWFDPFGGHLPFLLLFTGWDTLRALFGFRTSAMLMLARRRGGA
jgi:SAM-dependent methyltransferase